MQDKRKYIRFEVPLRAELIIKSTVEFLEKGVTKDFSREGLKLILHNCNLTTGSEVDAKLHVPKHREAVPVKGEIVWIKPEEENWEIGIRIKHINKEIKTEILDEAYKIWRWKD